MSGMAIFELIYFVSAAAVLFAMAVSFQPSTRRVMFTGTVSCAKCVGSRQLPKGYTRWRWAQALVRNGDDVVFVVGKQTFTLKGDRDQLLKYMQDKATITGDLQGQTLLVQTVTFPKKNRYLTNQKRGPEPSMLVLRPGTSDVRCKLRF
jgi:hypothetical protein